MAVIRINDNSRSAFTPESTQYTMQCCLEKDSGFRRQLHFALATDMTCQLSKEVTDRGHTYSKRVFKTRWLEIQLPRWRIELGLWTSSGFLLMLPQNKLAGWQIADLHGIRDTPKVPRGHSGGYVASLRFGLPPWNAMAESKMG